MNALIYLYHKTGTYVFEGSVLANDCGIPDDKIDAVLEDLIQLKVIWKQNLTINAEERTIYHSKPNHKLIALFIMAQEIGYNGPHCMVTNTRTTPLIRE